MNGPKAVGAGRPADGGAGAPALDDAVQAPKATRQPAPGAVYARLMGQSPAGAAQNASFKAPGGTQDSFDHLDTLTQRMRGAGFSNEQLDALGNHALLSKLAEMWPAIRLHGEVKSPHDFVVAVGSTEGADGLQRLYEMALAPNGAALLNEKAESMRRAKPDTH